VRTGTFYALLAAAVIVSTVLAMAAIAYGPSGHAGEPRHLDFSWILPPDQGGPQPLIVLQSGTAIAITLMLCVLAVGAVITFHDGFPSFRRRLR